MLWFQGFKAFSVSDSQPCSVFSLKTRTWAHLDGVLFLVHLFPKLGLNCPWTSLMGLASCLLPSPITPPSYPQCVSTPQHCPFWHVVHFLCTLLPLLLDEVSRNRIRWLFLYASCWFFWLKVKGTGHYFKTSDFPLCVCTRPCSPVKDLACLNYALVYPLHKISSGRLRS